MSLMYLSEYKPSYIDSVRRPRFPKLTPQLPTCALPASITNNGPYIYIYIYVINRMIAKTNKTGTKQ